MTDGNQPVSYVGPTGGVSGGLEAARSKGVLGFDGIKMIEWMINCVHSYLPCNAMPLGYFGWKGLRGCGVISRRLAYAC